jgi:hypothetical protein
MERNAQKPFEIHHTCDFTGELILLALPCGHIPGKIQEIEWTNYY